MALKVQLVAPATPRDRLDRLLDYVRRSRRYWWVVMLFILLGGALSVVFALTRPPLYQSGSVLFYQERIQSMVLQGRDAATVQRNIGERYRELLLARSSLAQIIKDPKLNPYPETVASEGEDMAVEELRLAVGFEVRGANTFRIVYSHTDPLTAKKVSEKLTELLLDKETRIRADQAQETVKFALEQKQRSTDEMKKRRRALAEFLSKHPEFAQDALEGASEGALVRRQAAGAAAPPITSSNPRIMALERQRQRIRARLNAGLNPTPPVRRGPSPEQIAAENLVREAERELAAANRELEASQSRYTERHPDVLKARDAVTSAQQRLRRAQAAVPRGGDDDFLPPPSPVDRAALERELGEVERAITTERTRESGGKAPPPVSASDEADTATKLIVQLETEYQELRQAVEEQLERDESLADSVSRAELQANLQIAEGGANLTIVDPAFVPKQPQGKGKRVLVMAGLVLFSAMGMALALGLAIIDDRLYRRIDLEHLELAPVLAVIPKARAKSRKRRRSARAGTVGDR